MAIQIIGDFWRVLESNKDYFNRIFNRRIKVYPHNDSREDAYNDILTYFHENNIFEKFDPRKILESQIRKALIKENRDAEEAAVLAKAKAALAADPMSSLILMGFDVDQKWKEFIGMYINKRLSEMYQKRQNYSKRFVHNNILIDYEESDRSSWLQTQSDVDSYKKACAKRSGDKGKRYPSRQSTDYRYATHTVNHLEAISANELDEKIQDRISSDPMLSKVYDCVVHMGFNFSDTAEIIGTNPTTVRNKMLKIREITNSLCK